MRTLLFTRVLALGVGVASAAAATSPPQTTTTGRLLRVRGPSHPQARSANRSSDRIATCRAPSAGTIIRRSTRGERRGSPYSSARVFAGPNPGVVLRAFCDTRGLHRLRPPVSPIRLGKPDVG